MKSKILILGALCALTVSVSAANDLPYTFVQGSWASVEPDGGDDGTGPVLDASFGVTDFVHLVGSYGDVDFDQADMTTWQVGAGVHHTLSQGFDVVGEATYVDADVSNNGTTANEDGYSVCGGARKKLAQAWEIGGQIEYVDLGTTDDTLIGVNALYSLRDRYAIGAGYKAGDSDTLQVGFRVSFGRR